MQHIDEACGILRKEVASESKYAGVAVVDPYFGVLLQRQTGMPVDEELEYYFSGMLPERCPKPWASVDRVLAPWNLKDNHWVAVEIDLAEWTVRVYDPDTRLTPERHLPGLLKPITHTLPPLMDGHQELHAKHAGKLPQPFKYNRVKGIPQNKQS